VPWAGLEPAHLSALPPQDSVSTNSTTRAYFGINSQLAILSKGSSSSLSLL
jgi:hypothetical protein